LTAKLDLEIEGTAGALESTMAEESLTASSVSKIEGKAGELEVSMTDVIQVESSWRVSQGGAIR
jgi:hypothetical protein